MPEFDGLLWRAYRTTALALSEFIVPARSRKSIKVARLSLRLASCGAVISTGQVLVDRGGPLKASRPTSAPLEAATLTVFQEGGS